MEFMTQVEMKALAREATEVVKKEAPSIVYDRIFLEALDQVAYHTDYLMGRLTRVVEPENATAILMAQGIIRDGLLNEIINQVRNDMLNGAGKRLKKFSKLSNKKK